MKECKRVIKEDGRICHFDIPDKSKMKLYYNLIKCRYYKLIRNGCTPGIGYWYSENELKLVGKELGLGVKIIPSKCYYRFHAIFSVGKRNYEF